MNATLADLLTSKKFIGALAGIIGGVLARFGFDVPLEDVRLITDLTIAYVVGQGVADHGKHAAAVNAEAAKNAAETTRRDAVD